MQAISEFWSSWLLPIITFIIGLNVVVFFHELGHYLAARWAKIKVERFALGMGPRLFGKKIGDTDYCICALPIGGYVAMLGQEDFGEVSEDDAVNPDSYLAKPIYQRLVVTAAGVTMNIILACILFIILALVGRTTQAPIVGEVLPTYPAALAETTFADDAPQALKQMTGLKEGDRILSIDGEPIEQFAGIKLSSALAHRDDVFDIEFQRSYDGKEYIGHANIGVRPIGGVFLGFGFDMPALTVISAVSDNDSGLQAGDKVIEIDGHKILSHADITKLRKTINKTEIPVVVERDGEKVSLTVRPAATEAPDVIYTTDGKAIRGTIEDINDDKTATIIKPDGEKMKISVDKIAFTGTMGVDVAGMLPRMSLEEITKRHKLIFSTPAAKAGLKAGDRIVSYDGIDYPSHYQLMEINKKIADEDRAAKMTIMRDDKLIDTEVETYSLKGKKVIGIVFSSDRETPVVGHIRKGSPAAKAGIKGGQKILAIAGKPVKDWLDIAVAVRQAAMDGKKSVEITTDKGKFTLEGLGKDFKADEIQTVIFPMAGFEYNEVTIRRTNPLAAIAWGFGEVKRNLLMNYASFGALARGTVPLRSVSGPIGIGKVSILTARKSFTDFVYLMAIISTALAVFNFLPLPVLDGGLATLLIIEKIHGKPLPLKLVNTIQLIGLAFIICLFLAVTLNDLGWI